MTFAPIIVPVRDGLELRCQGGVTVRGHRAIALELLSYSGLYSGPITLQPRDLVAFSDAVAEVCRQYVREFPGLAPKGPESPDATAAPAPHAGEQSAVPDDENRSDNR